MRIVPSPALAGALAAAGLAAWLGMPASGAAPPDPPSIPPGSLATYGWPVTGPVIRPFEPPSSPYGSGHRGIDIATAVGTRVRVAQSGRVAFAGTVAGSLFVSVDHPDGIRTTYSWLSGVDVERGDSVVRGQVIARTGKGDPSADLPNLHFGARIGAVYIDPMLLLERGSIVGLVHLAPLEAGAA